jgi:GntR family transcriptional regulator
VRLHVDPYSPVPLYAQIADGLRLAIARAEVRVGERLPTIRQLAVDLKVNSNTVARVYAELEAEGLLETNRGGGTSVKASPSRKPPDAAHRRLDSLCRAFIRTCSAEGFTLAQIRRTFRDLSREKGSSS